MINLIGQKFSKWIVIQIGIYKKEQYWLCECECGIVKEVRERTLLGGRSTSCGCARTEAVRKKNRKSKGESGFNMLYTSYKIRARKRGLEFTLTKEEFKELTQRDCFYCNKPPKQTRATSKLSTDVGIEYSKYTFNGIDRINNSIGYIKDNCAPCCKDCNSAKMEMNIEEFILFIKRIYNNICSGKVYA